uniref:Uncharacterized protein n=1 Tax=Panagrolaimus sp. PS1159 TaxID=55785 RepID=A0AC35GXU3_9BILA
MFGFFFNFTIVITVIGGNIWDFYDPMPQPFDVSWGRRCFNHPQYIYLYYHNERIAKTSVYTKLDDLYVQSTMEHILTALFAIPGIVMPYVLFKAAYTKNYAKLIYCCGSYDDS